MKYLLIILFGVAAFSAGAQTIQPLYTFTGQIGENYTPLAPLTLAPDGNFYGTTSGGGTNFYYGSLFRITTNGSLTTLASLAKTNGSNPNAAMLLGPDGNLYGTTGSGGKYGHGTVFKLTTAGALTWLANFDGTNESALKGGLALGPDGNFYGAAYFGSSNYSSLGGSGALYRMTPDGTLTTPYFFSPLVYNFNISAYTNTDGANPLAGLTLGPDGNFYGTTSLGGKFGNGTLFKVTTNGTFALLHSFTLTTSDNRGDHTNSDGISPSSTLTVGPDGNIYGSTSEGGLYDAGTLFRITTNGIFTPLVNFNGTNGASRSESAPEKCFLVLGPDGNFYGTTQYGGNVTPAGTTGYGTVFRMTINGTLTSLASFNSTNGANPNGLTLGADGNFYGTTPGNVYRLNLPVIIPPVMVASAFSYSNGTVRFNCSTTTNVSSRVYSATNLTQPFAWLAIYTNLNGGVWQFTDTNAGQSKIKIYQLSTP